LQKADVQNDFEVQTRRPARAKEILMKLSPTIFTISALLCCSGAHHQSAARGATDGARPESGLTLSGSTLYGTTPFGGDGGGTIYRVETDGTGYQLVHSFAGEPKPIAELTIDGSRLFGTTADGGEHGGGTVFSLNTDGTDFRLLHEFSSAAGDERNPHAPLLLGGSTLFGTTRRGGINDEGTIFSIDKDGTNLRLLHEFTGGDGDGRSPFEAGLTLSGSALFGTTPRGGDADVGTIFTVNTDGTGFGLLHDFVGGPNDGRSPSAGLTLAGSTLFGTTPFGGDYDFDFDTRDYGTVFAINTDGTDFAVLHEFGLSTRFPAEELTLSGSTLFGTTSSGGDHGDRGTIFSMNTDGTGFTLLHSFAGGGDDGERPSSQLTLSGSTLFGTTHDGGDHNLGTVFAINTDGTGFRLLHEFSGAIPEPSTLILVLAAVSLSGIFGYRRRHEEGRVGRDRRTRQSTIP
jgi:uncharacterized repeat protein (TIGR03803 family)